MLALSGGAWTAVVAGLVVIPVVGMLIVGVDTVSAYNDLIRVRTVIPGEVEEEQARHTLYAQVARAAVLAAISLLAVLELVDVLTANEIAGLVYVIAVVSVVDAWRARRSRKRIVAMLETDGQE